VVPGRVDRDLRRPGEPEFSVKVFPATSKRLRRCGNHKKIEKRFGDVPGVSAIDSRTVPPRKLDPAEFDFGPGLRNGLPMHSRIRSAGACGPTGWLLAFLNAREQAMRTHNGLAAGPAEWLLVFLEVERTELAARQRPERAAPLLSRRGRSEESPFGRLTARSA